MLVLRILKMLQCPSSQSYVEAGACIQKDCCLRWSTKCYDVNMLNQIAIYCLNNMCPDCKGTGLKEIQIGDARFPAQCYCKPSSETDQRIESQWMVEWCPKINEASSDYHCYRCEHLVAFDNDKIISCKCPVDLPHEELVRKLGW